MSRIFLSHSSADELEAVALQHWLADNGWEDVFLDLDPVRGLAAGERWQEALRKAADRCEAVVFLVSPSWAKSRWCLAEFLLAKSLHKLIFGVVIKDTPFTELPTEMTAEWQLCRLTGSGPMEAIRFRHRDADAAIDFLTEGLGRLKTGLQKAGLGADYFPWPPKDEPKRPPFRGLEPLDVQDAAMFFGRDVEVLRGLDALRGLRENPTKRLFVILGASGTGKSSFLRAGLLPRLAREDRHFLPLPVVRPETAPISGDRGLAQALAQTMSQLKLAAATPGELKARLNEGTEEFASLLHSIQSATRDRLLASRGESTPPAPTLVLPVDQAEELFNADAGPEARQFLRMIAAVVRSGLQPQDAESRPVSLIVAFTIRSDRYEPLQTAPELAGLQSLLFDDLRPMAATRFREVITGPAAQVSKGPQKLVIQPQLVDRLVEECATGGDTLPLLGFTLERLYQDFGAGGELLLKHYTTLGGLKEVVRTRIESVLDRDPKKREAQLVLLRHAFIPSLVTINPQNDQPMRRVARRSELPAESLPLLDALVENRLLLCDQRGGAVVLEIAHEALLRQWELFFVWLREELVALKEADALERESVEWKERRKKGQEDESRLWRGQRLQGAMVLAARPDFQKRLKECAEFLVHCHEKQRERFAKEALDRAEKLKAAEALALAQRARARIAVGLGTVALALALVALGFYGKANRDGESAKKSEQTATNALAKAEAAKQDLTTALVETQVARSNAQHSAKLAFDAATIASNQTVRAETALAESQQRLERAEIEEGRAWVERAKLNQSRTNYFAAALMAGRAFGYVNHGRTNIAGTPLFTYLPVLLTPTNAPVDEAAARSALADALTSLRTEGGLPLWQSPIGRHHADAVTCVAFSPDGKTVASASGDNTVKLWEAGSGKVLATFTGHAGAVESVAFSPDGKTVASGSWDKTVKLWEVGSGKVLATFSGHASGVESVAFSPDGKTVASGSDDNTVKLWGAGSGKVLATFPGHAGGVTSVAFSPDGKTVASGSWDNTVKLWAAGSGKLLATFSGHARAVLSVAFSPDGKTVASGSSDKTVRLWEAGSGKVLATFTGHADRVSSVAFSPDGKTVASGSYDSKVKLWEMGSGKVLATFSGHASGVESVAFSPDGSRVASGSSDKTVKLWAAWSGKDLATFSGHADSVHSVAFSADGKTVASGSEDRTVKLWEAGSRKVLATFTGHANGMTSVAFSPGGKTVASGSYDNTVKLWAAGSAKPLATFSGHADRVSSVAFSPDGKTVASGSYDNTVKLWAAGSGKVLATFTGHTDRVSSVAFSPDGKTVASGSYDRKVKLWEAGSGKLLATFSGHADEVWSVAFSPDGKTVASGSSDKTVKLWEAGSGKLLATFTGHASSVSSVAFSPDGKKVASASGYETVKLWAAGSGKVLASFNDRVDRERVESVAFSPDGKTVASGSYEKTVNLWDAETGRQWNLADYLQGWVKLEGSELVWQDTTDNLFTERQFPVLNVPPGSLVALYGQDQPAVQRRTNCLSIFLRARNWPAAVQVWSEIAGDGPAPLPVRQDYVFHLAVTAAEDVASGLFWRANWLAREALTNCTAEVLQNPAVSLATLRLARELNSSTNADFAPLREECLSRLRALAPPHWQEALAAQPKITQPARTETEK